MFFLTSSNAAQVFESCSCTEPSKTFGKVFWNFPAELNQHKPLANAEGNSAEIQQ
jgi:hypothetical protein